MPLIPANLANGILAFSVAPPTMPQNPNQTATDWANALRAFFATMALPTLLPTALVLGHDAMVAAMAPLVTFVPGAGAIALGAGFAAFVGVFPAQAVPPQIVIPPPALFVPPPLPPINDPNIPAALIAAAALAWCLTGTVTIPPAPPVPWA